MAKTCRYINCPMAPARMRKDNLLETIWKWMWRKVNNDGTILYYNDYGQPIYPSEWRIR